MGFSGGGQPGWQCHRCGDQAATQAPSQGDVVKIQFDPNYTNEAITLLLGTNYKAGSVRGKITASGKYKLATAAGADGAQIAAAVLLNPVDANLGLVHRDSEWQPYWEG